MRKAKEEPGDIVNTVGGDIYGGTVIQGRDIHVVNHVAHVVDWPVRVGTIPEQAAHYQHRAVADHLDTALNSFGTVVLRQVLSGAGGVGKTQLAAHYARVLARTTDPGKRVDVLVWANAATREQITHAYAQAARHLYAIVPDDPEDAAKLFLTWLNDPNKHQNRRWLVVWDDLADPAHTKDLWPPHDQSHGRTLVTTRRRDRSLTNQGRHLLDVDVYTLDEARTFLTRALDEAGIAHTIAEVDALARDLGYLPLALGQAVTYMAELGMGCDDYLQAFHDRMNTLDQVFPDWDSPVPLAATWDLSLAQADTFAPQGVARPMMGLVALLDGAGIPEQVLTAPPVLEYLAAHRTKETGSATAPTILTSHQARAALAGLQRWNLITCTVPPGATERHAPEETLIGAHQLVQRATREHRATGPGRRSVQALADALLQIWPKVERNTTLTQQLRNNTAALRSHHSVEGRNSEAWLWEPAGHRLLFRAGKSLGECGRVQEAVSYCEQLVDHARHYLGPDHPDTFASRNNLADARGKAGDIIGAATAYEKLIQDELRIFGPDHPKTLKDQSNLTFMLSESGKSAGASTTYEKILQVQHRILGPDHLDVLITRNNLAFMRGQDGDIDGAIQDFGNLLKDQIRILGPDHLETLNTRRNLAELRGLSGDIRGADIEYEKILTDQLRTLGTDHPSTLRTRQGIAELVGKSGDSKGAIIAYEKLLSDRLRTLGPDHPHTLNARYNIAFWRMQDGNLSRAFVDLKDLLQDEIRVLGPNHPGIFTTRISIAVSTFELGDVVEAIKILSAIFRDQKRAFGPKHDDTLLSAELLRQWRENLTQ
ncbi:tetratricopeptide repeat protein [Nocardiopsis dassonvillei]